jgi:hypothetical protein
MKDSARGAASRAFGADPLEVDVVEKNTETSWALFEALQHQHERGFEQTAAAGLEPVASSRRGGDLTVDDVIVEIRRNNRVCPLPKVWQKLYEFLPNKTPALATVPATAEEWQRLSSLQKRTRLKEHIEWAAAQGVLKQVHAALQRLPEDRWFHMGG